MRLLILAAMLTGCGTTRYICAGDRLPMTYEIKVGESVSFPDNCAYDWQGGEVATAGGGKPILFEAGR